MVELNILRLPRWRERAETLPDAHGHADHVAESMMVLLSSIAAPGLTQCTEYTAMQSVLVQARRAALCALNG